MKLRLFGRYFAMSSCCLAQWRLWARRNHIFTKAGLSVLASHEILAPPVGFPCNYPSSGSAFRLYMILLFCLSPYSMHCRWSRFSYVGKLFCRTLGFPQAEHSYFTMLFLTIYASVFELFPGSGHCHVCPEWVDIPRCDAAKFLRTTKSAHVFEGAAE